MCVNVCVCMQAQVHVSKHISLSQDKLSLTDANSKMKIEIARLRARCDELSARTHELQARPIFL